MGRPQTWRDWGDWPQPSSRRADLDFSPRLCPQRPVALDKSRYLSGPPFSQFQNGGHVPTLHIGWGEGCPGTGWGAVILLPTAGPCHAICLLVPAVRRRLRLLHPRPSPLGGGDGAPSRPLPDPILRFR